VTANKILRKVMPRALAESQHEISWSVQEEDWEQARQEVLDAIEVECDDGTELAR
jgi:hypothetical protein